jgi:acetyl esterase/lipase
LTHVISRPHDTYPPVPLAPEFEHQVRERARRRPLTLESLRSRPDKRRPATGDQVRALDADIEYEDLDIPGPPGAPAVPVTVLRPRRLHGSAPVLVNLHGGGLITGHRSQDTARLAPFVDGLGVVAVNVDYRLAPAHPFPAAVDDAYAALAWTARAASAIGADPARIVLMGSSAGGGLAAATALMARDRGGPQAAGLLLLYPMLDDRNETVSSHQVTLATWTRSDNELAWRCILGDAAGGTDVSPYAAPARADSLKGLPPAYVEASGADIFRDEDVAWASRAWEDGVQVHLTVFGATPHGHDVLAAESRFAAAAHASRTWWLRTLLDLPAA